MTARASIISVAAAAFALWAAPSALAGSHTWRITEVFSNASGTIQFIEMQESGGGAFEVGINGHNLTSNANTFLIPGPALTSPTSNKRVLFATAGYAALPGAPTPDYTIPANFINPAGDTISYVPWDSWTFGAMPTDCLNSLQRAPLPPNTVTTAPNNPVNYSGGHATVSCACVGDISPAGGNGSVDVNDLLTVINHWGRCAGGPGCLGDFVPPGGSGGVDVNDLLGVINHWGPCS